MQIVDSTIFMSTMWLHLSREKGKRLLDLFSSGFFLLEEYIKNSKAQCKTTVRSGGRRPSAFTLVLGSIYLMVFRQCDVYLFWPSNDSENVERRTYIPPTLNSMSVQYAFTLTPVKGKHQRRILTPIASKSHTHPSHSQTSRLLTSSLSLGVPVPRATQCMRGV